MALAGRIVSADPTRGLWALESRYDPKLVGLCKSVPGLKWNGGARKWVGYRDALEALAAKAGREGFEIQVPPLPVNPHPNARFPDACRRAYQCTAAAFLLERGREGCILGDAMGLGKTCSLLTAAHGVGKLIVVCPSYVRNVWRDELAKWAAGRVPFFPEGVKRRAAIPPECNTIVLHYDILDAWADDLIAWGPEAIAFDEGHMLQSETTKRGKAARRVATACEYRWALTGTPMTNRPKDLWHVVDVISPGRLGSFFGFALAHCDGHKEQVTPEKVVWVFKGASRLEELRERAKYFMLRRTVEDVGLELPPKTRQVIYLDVGAKGVSGSYDGSPGALRRDLDLGADAKLPGVWDLLRGHLEGGARVVCFTWRRNVAEGLADKARVAGFEAECVHGGISHQRRGLAIERARAWEGAGLFVATIDSASTGVDLTFASVVLFAEIDYKPHALLQAEARCHRFGQGLPVLIQYALAKGTIDEVIAGVVIAKLDTFAAAIGPTGEALGDDLRGNEAGIMAELCAAIEASTA